MDVVPSLLDCISLVSDTLRVPFLYARKRRVSWEDVTPLAISSVPICLSVFPADMPSVMYVMICSSDIWA